MSILQDNIQQNYQDFWQWFQKNEKTFFEVVKNRRGIETDFFEKLTPQLNKIKEGFFFLTGMYDDHTVELVFTADGYVKNMVFVEELVQAAPQIAGWLFTALKPSINIENLGIEMAGFKFDRENMSFYATDYEDFPDEIDITIVHDDFNEANKSPITNGVYIFLDNYLGELNFATTIDHLEVVGKKQAQQDLIPLEKLKDYLIWREKEFIEKYGGIKLLSESSNYAMFQAELESGMPLIAMMNIDLLDWDSKASHPWILHIDAKYDGQNNNGLPDTPTYELLNQIEDKILEYLTDKEGYLSLGRQTAENIREIYFACKDFRKPSKVMFFIQKLFANQIELTYDIYKDKYWQSFDRFRNASNNSN